MFSGTIGLLLQQVISGADDQFCLEHRRLDVNGGKTVGRIPRTSERGCPAPAGPACGKDIGAGPALDGTWTRMGIAS